MTEKLFYEDQYIKDFSAEIINIIEKDSEFHIELDKTAFFPTQDISCKAKSLGSQFYDTGTIEDSVIAYVYEKAGIIYHVSNKKPIKIHRVKCKINWASRFDAMQQSLGRHILSAAVLELFGANTLDFNLGKDSSSINIDKLLTTEEQAQIEELVNKNILERKKVEFFIPTKAELKKLSHKKSIVNGDVQGVRGVRLEDMDIALCGDLYPKSTIELQFLKVKKSEKLKGNVLKIEFLCGNRAVINALSNYSFSNKICEKLKCDEEEALRKVENISSEFNNLQAENKNMKAQIADFEVQALLNDCEKLGDIRIVRAVFENSDVKYVNLLSTKLTSFDNVVVLHAVKAEGMATLIYMCSKNLKALDMNALLKDAISLIDGKGGGSSFSAQGGGKAVHNLQSAMDYAYLKIKNAIKI